MADTNPTPKTRICTKCGIAKPETLEHFALEKRDYILFKARCRECWKEYLKQYRQNNPNKDKDYYQQNKSRINAQNNAYYYKRLEEDPEYNRKNYQANKEAILARMRITGRRKRAENGDEVRRKANEYRVRTLEQNKANQTNYRARKRQASGTITAGDIRNKLASQQGLCWWCFVEFPNGEYQIDHVMPFARGGQNWPDNVVLSCAECNLKKHAKMPSEFMRGR